MQLLEDLDQEPVSALPTREVIALNADTIVRGAVARMRAADIGVVVIVDVCGRPSGFFTEKSLIDLLNQGDDLDASTIGAYPDPDFVLVKQSEPIRKVWEAVVTEGKRFVCLIDDDRRPIAMTGQRGLAEYVSDLFPREVLVQRIGGKPWMTSKEGA